MPRARWLDRGELSSPQLQPSALQCFWIWTVFGGRFAMHWTDYMEDAGSETDSYEAGSQVLSQYEQCSMDSTSLLSIYKQTMAMTDRAHRSLKKAWRHVSNLFGELASHLEDGEAFVTFLQQEGCQSPLAFQTLEQARGATSGMRMLYHRFAVSGLPAPSVERMGSTVNRIKGSWATAQQAICDNQGQLPHW